MLAQCMKPSMQRGEGGGEGGRKKENTRSPLHPVF